MWEIFKIIIWANVIVTVLALAFFLHGWFKSK